MTRSLFLTAEPYYTRQAAKCLANRILDMERGKSVEAIASLIIDLSEFQKLDPCRVSMKAHLVARNSGSGN